MSALSHIQDYLKARFAGHDIETLMQHFETAIEAKVEEAVAGLRHEIEALREELMGGRPPVMVPEGFNPAPGGLTIVTASGGQPIADQPEPAKSGDDMPASAGETGSAA